MIDVVAISNDERGRCVVATTELKRGTIVSDETPLVWLKFTDNDATTTRTTPTIQMTTTSIVTGVSRGYNKTSHPPSSSVNIGKIEKYCSFDRRRLASPSIIVNTGSVAPLKLAKKLKRMIQYAIVSTICPIGSPYARMQN